MKSHDINTKVAEICGWKNIKRGYMSYDSPSGLMGEFTNEYGTHFIAVPDYYKDLNAMHQAENLLSHDQNKHYELGLLMAVQKGWVDSGKNIMDREKLRQHWAATSEQRAEVFIFIHEEQKQD